LFGSSGCEDYDVENTSNDEQKKYYLFSAENFPQYKVTQDYATDGGKLIDNADYCYLYVLGCGKVDEVRYCSLKGAKGYGKYVTFTDAVVKNSFELCIHETYKNEHGPG
jgi:hypothetical protein